MRFGDGARTSTRTMSPKRRRRSSSLDRLEQVVRLVGDLEVSVSGDAERAVLEASISGKSRQRKWRMIRSSGMKRPRSPTGRSAVAAPGPHSSEPFLSGLGVTDEAARLSDRAEI